MSSDDIGRKGNLIEDTTQRKSIALKLNELNKQINVENACLIQKERSRTNDGK